MPVLLLRLFRGAGGEERNAGCTGTRRGGSTTYCEEVDEAPSSWSVAEGELSKSKESLSSTPLCGGTVVGSSVESSSLKFSLVEEESSESIVDLA